ncbi:MAG: alpha-E domain-containing protein [Hahellaceae bacterium]|nr:alpha-E domain-containing protein [Hahellaceae bacterium]
MLSKVAERIYWTARHLERVENTARLISVYDNLLFDLPDELDISWYNLVTLNSADDLFAERYKNRDERNVVKFLLADNTNPSSMLSALQMVRENVRTTRDVLPKESWEMVNELYIFANAEIQQGLKRSARHGFLEQMVRGCQQINGLFAGTMRRDACWQFLSLGRNLERADMLTRLLDAGAAAQIQGEAETDVRISQVVWGNVLRSSSAELCYRRTMRSAVHQNDVAKFLLQDSQFPRSLKYCLDDMLQSVKALPNRNKATEAVNAALGSEFGMDEGKRLGVEFRDYLNQQQLNLRNLHQVFSEIWFPVV